ncbi:MAG: nucleotidyltransferase domain-containing protein [Thermomicrobiales bacterium]
MALLTSHRYLQKFRGTTRFNFLDVSWINALSFVSRIVYTNPMMRTADVLEIVACLSAATVAVWLDGGWGVDALLGEQTRPHDDLDIVMEMAQLGAARDALCDLGFVLTVDELPTRCVLRDAGDRRIDVHPVEFDSEGGGTQQQPDGSAFRYPPEGLSGTGTIAGHPVRCLTPELQLRCHLAYEPDDDDRHDMRLLCERFSFALPAAYERSL